MQGHFRSDPFQGLCFEVSISHPVFDCTKRMLNRFTALAHPLRMFIKTTFDIFKDIFVFPTSDPAFPGRGALILDGAGRTRLAPITAHGEPRLDIGEVIDQTLTGRTKVDIVDGHIAKVGLNKLASGFAAGSLRLW